MAPRVSWVQEPGDDVTFSLLPGHVPMPIWVTQVTSVSTPDGNGEVTIRYSTEPP